VVAIVARLCPNKLTFHGGKLDGLETEEGQSVQVSLALPRDGGLTPYVPSLSSSSSVLTIDSIVPRRLGGDDAEVSWPLSSAHVSFAGPVDLDTFHIKDGAWPEKLGQMKTAC